MRSSFVLSLLAVVAPALGAPTLTPITKHAGPFKQNSYIIKIKDDASKPAFVDTLTKLFAGSQSSVTYDYGETLHAVAVLLDSLDLKPIQAMKNVEYIEQDGIMSISHELELDETPLPVDVKGDVLGGSGFTKRTGQPEGNKGDGVVIYGIDTGIFTEHECFGGRAQWGKTFGGYADADGNGHGTHTAGTAAGDRYGPATKSLLKAVKVLSDAGSGATSDVIAGINWVVVDSKTHGDPSVANMSLGGPISPSTDTAVRNGVKAGVHFTVAAGNSNVLAESASPARVKEAITVGAVDDKKAKASFSNYGPVLDVWAPGVNVLSAWFTGPRSTATLSGTSMAAPCVAGIIAVAISNHGNKAPDQLIKDLQQNAEPVVKGALLSTNLLAKQW